MSHSIRKEIFSLSRLLFSVLICTEFAVKVRLCWWEGSCRAFCPVSVFSSFGLALPSLSLLFLAAGDTGQQVTREQEMMPWKPLPVVLVAAAEGAGVNIINPNPKLFNSLLLIFAVLFIFP